MEPQVTTTNAQNNGANAPYVKKSKTRVDNNDSLKVIKKKLFI